MVGQPRQPSRESPGSDSKPFTANPVTRFEWNKDVLTLNNNQMWSEIRDKVMTERCPTFGSKQSTPAQPRTPKLDLLPLVSRVNKEQQLVKIVDTVPLHLCDSDLPEDSQEQEAIISIETVAPAI